MFPLEGVQCDSGARGQGTADLTSLSRVPAAHPEPCPTMAPAHDVSEPLEVGGCEVPVVAVTSLHILVYAVQV